MASHDLQEPLRKVTSFVQLLQQRYEGQLDERADQYIAFAVDGATRMQQLISDLLAFSRVGRDTERFEVVPMADCLRAALDNLEPSIDRVRRPACDVALLPDVCGDRALLISLWQNLIANSVKFHAEDAAAEILIDAVLDPDQREWQFSVADNGIGIEPRFAEKIFVIFQRLHGRDRYPGTGIGLALCQKIVDFHGGRIWLDTTYQGGARICFTLPVVGREGGRMIEVTPSARIDLLLVEDDPGDAMMTREALSNAKVLHDLHVVDNGEAAIAFLRQEPPYADAPRPDLIFLDLNLPRVDGREVLAFVKGDPSLRRIPLVVLTTSRLRGRHRHEL